MHIAHMHTLDPGQLVADIAHDQPATIVVFQRHKIEFCCGGKIPLREACARLGLDETAILDQLQQAMHPAADDRNWREASLESLATYILRHQHDPLSAEMPRLHAMLQRVVSRHAERAGHRVEQLLGVYETLQHEWFVHARHAEDGLFAVLTQANDDDNQRRELASSLPGVVGLMRAEHAAFVPLLADVRRLTDDFTPPDWACPTFRGLYHGLGQLQADLTAHMTLEHEVLFPRLMTSLR